MSETTGETSLQEKPSQQTASPKEIPAKLAQPHTEADQQRETIAETPLSKFLSSLDILTPEDRERFEEMRTRYLLQLDPAHGEISHFGSGGYERWLEAHKGTAEEISHLTSTLKIEDPYSESQLDERDEIIKKAENAFLQEQFPLVVNTMIARGQLPTRVSPKPQYESVEDERRGIVHPKPIYMDDVPPDPATAFVMAAQGGNITAIAAGVQALRSQATLERNIHENKRWHAAEDHSRTLKDVEKSDELNQDLRHRSLELDELNRILQDRLHIDGNKLIKTPWSAILAAQADKILPSILKTPPASTIE